MGPPFFDGGNNDTWLADVAQTALQWGRRFLTAETPPGMCGGDSSARLQWGRRFFTAETGINAPADLNIWRASMGPPFFDGGNEKQKLLWTVEDMASMGPPFFDGGNPLQPRPPGHPAARFNGAAVF